MSVIFPQNMQLDRSWYIRVRSKISIDPNVLLLTIFDVLNSLLFKTIRLGSIKERIRTIVEIHLK
jgi:hypothetical protein